MLVEYKIQKVVDGNDEKNFKILSHRISTQKWWKKKKWEVLTTGGPNRYGVKDFYKSLGEAQNVLRMQMEADADQEYSQNRYKIKVVKEYSYAEIPSHIPEEQEEKFCDLGEVTS